MKPWLFIVSLLLLSVLVIPKIVLASDNSSLAEEEGKPVMVQTNDYQLAYPGMLPDNPLYKLKVLRDKIWEFLVTDPAKKVDFYLLQTDKQTAMVPLLIAKKEVDLAKTTALKAENNFTNLVFVYRGNGSKPDANTYKKLLQAALKHQEVLTKVAQQVNGNDAKTFQQVINFSKTNVDALTKIYNERMK